MLFREFHAIVQQQPEAIAIDTPKGSITYQDLYIRACAYARTIHEQAPSREYIGLLADQDPEAVAAIIALAAIGKVVVPVDSRLNQQLVKTMLESFTDTILIGEGGKMPALDGFACHRLGHVMAAESKAIELPQDTDDMLAYVLHTSGTTGQPKAVLARQDALCRVVHRLAARYYIGSASRVLQFAYLSFDSALVEIWSTLLHGGILVVPGAGLRSNLYGTLHHLLVNQQITVATLPPSGVLHCNPEEFSGMEALIVAGESCPPALANTVRRHVSHLINAYGPTEAIICATTYEVAADMNTYVPIGTALPGTEIILVDPESGQPSHTDEGEIYIASDSLAEGYPTAPVRTTERFAQDSSISERRYYRSGDIAKRLPDGNLVFLGRLDNQIKVNGQRIELESIEAVLQKHALIKRAVVVAINEGAVKALHCAYEASEELAPADLVQTLRRQIQDFAIPKSYVRLPALPTDRTGKVDRKAITELIRSAVTAIQPALPSSSDSTAVGKMIALWKDVLDLQRAIAPDDDFFELGGESLAALRLVASINKTFGIEIDLTDIIVEPMTPSRMAKIVSIKRQGV